MTTGNNKENPYGNYVPGQYSSGSTPAPEQQDAAPSSSNYGQQGYGQADYSQQAGGYPSYGHNPYGQQLAQAPKGLAIASLVLGILAFLGGWAIVGGILGIVGLVLGIVALRKTKTGGGGKGLAITGIVLSVLGILTSIVVLVFFGWVFSAFGDCMVYEDEAQVEQCINQQLGLEGTESTSNI